MNNDEKKRQAADLLRISLTIAIVSILLPAVLPKQLTLSPFLIFGIIFLSNIATLVVPEDIPRRGVGIFSRAFFGRLAISTVFAIILIFISKIASNF